MCVCVCVCVCVWVYVYVWVGDTHLVYVLVIYIINLYNISGSINQDSVIPTPNIYAYFIIHNMRFTIIDYNLL